LPAFTVGRGDAGIDDVLDGFKLTGFFLDRHIFAARGMDPPESRARLIAKLKAATVS
jgi:DNA repair protein RecO (recombination protein O)